MNEAGSRALSRLQAACRLVAETFYGADGLWLCNAFEAINEAYFAGELPYPHLTIEITAHSRCLAWCSSHPDRPPRMAIHPTVLGFRELENPWGVPTEWLGRAFAFDVLIHECLHASVHYRLGGSTGPTSHNNAGWVSEVNRIAPLLGFEGVEAGRQVAKRVPIEGGGLTKRARKPTAVRKVTEGNVPFLAVATFPLGLRIHRQTATAYYPAGKLSLDFSGNGRT